MLSSLIRSASESLQLVPPIRIVQSPPPALIAIAFGRADPVPCARSPSSSAPRTPRPRLQNLLGRPWSWLGKLFRSRESSLSRCADCSLAARNGRLAVNPCLRTQPSTCPPALNQRLDRGPGTCSSANTPRSGARWPSWNQGNRSRARAPARPRHLAAPPPAPQRISRGCSCRTGLPWRTPFPRGTLTSRSCASRSRTGTAVSWQTVSAGPPPSSGTPRIGSRLCHRIKPCLRLLSLEDGLPRRAELRCQPFPKPPSLCGSRGTRTRFADPDSHHGKVRNLVRLCFGLVHLPAGRVRVTWSRVQRCKPNSNSLHARRSLRLPLLIFRASVRSVDLFGIVSSYSARS